MRGQEVVEDPNEAAKEAGPIKKNHTPRVLILRLQHPATLTNIMAPTHLSDKYIISCEKSLSRPRPPRRRRASSDCERSWLPSSTETHRWPP